MCPGRLKISRRVLSCCLQFRSKKKRMTKRRNRLIRATGIMVAKSNELTPTHIGAILLELKPKLERRPSREEMHIRGFIKSNVDVVQGTLARRSIASSLERAMSTRPSSTDLIESGVMQSEGLNTEGIWQYEMARQKWLPATSNEPAPRRLARQFGYTYGASVHVTIRESDVHATD